jgi:ABC-type polysaccharide/polyol phosphate export permease
MFPAEILPMVKIVSSLCNYLFTLPLLFGFMLWYGVKISPALVWLPFIMAAQLLFTMGLVYFLAALNVRFRDVQHVLANVMILWFFLCPITYPLSSIPERWRFTFSLNPMAVLAAGYQDIFIYAKTPSLLSIAWVMLAGGVALILGVRQFEQWRETFAEEI